MLPVDGAGMNSAHSSLTSHQFDVPIQEVAQVIILGSTNITRESWAHVPVTTNALFRRNEIHPDTEIRPNFISTLCQWSQ